MAATALEHNYRNPAAPVHGSCTVYKIHTRTVFHQCAVLIYISSSYFETAQRVYTTERETTATREQTSSGLTYVCI